MPVARRHIVVRWPEPPRIECQACKGTGAKHIERYFFRRVVLVRVKPYAPCRNCFGTGFVRAA
jgi:DnaJ-class molecular chaperone